MTRQLVAVSASVALGLAVSSCSQPGDPTSDEGLLDAVRTVEIEDRSHVDGQVDYDQVPPLGGPHAPTWANCGYYAEQVVPSEFAVHSMEHGAVWLAYPQDGGVDTDALRDLATGQSHVLISPAPDVDQVTATAWGAQVTIDNIEDPVLAAFLEAYVQGPQTPEPGAPCSGGIGEPS